MTIEVWDGNNWQDVDDPEICTSINPTTGARTFTNIQRGEIYTASGWESFYIRSVGEGAPAKAPVIAFYKKGSRKIEIYVSHENTTGDKVKVLVYATKGATGNFIYNSGTKSNPDSGYDIDGFSNEIEFFGSNDYNSLLDNNTATDESAGDGFILYKGAAYNISCVAQYYNNSNGLIKSVGGNTLTVTTHPYFTAGTPVSLASYVGVALKTSTALYMYAQGNAYNNGTAWLRWQYQSRNAGSGSAWTDLGTVDDSSNAFTDNQSNQDRGRSFTSLDNDKEYQFRARVVYAGLGNSNSEVGAWGSYSNFIRPLYSKSEVIGVFAAMNDTTYFRAIGTGTDKSEISATSNYDSDTTPAKASDGNGGTVWLSDPRMTMPAEERNITAIRRDGSYVYYSASALTNIDSVTTVTTENIEKLQGIISTTKRENGGGSTFYVNIRGISSTIYPFNASDNSVVIAGLSDSVTNGTKNLDKRAADNELRYISFVSAYDSAYKSDGGTITSTTSGGSAVTNLNIPKAKNGTLESGGFSGTIKVATADVGTTLQFSLTTVIGTNTPKMTINGSGPKGPGTETLNAYFNVKSEYSYAWIGAGDNSGVSVTNGDLATTIKVFLNNTQINVGNESFGANVTKNLEPSSTKYATFAPEYKDTAFYVRLEVTRVNTGFGYYAKVQEVKLKFRYLTLNYDDGIT